MSGEGTTKGSNGNDLPGDDVDLGQTAPEAARTVLGESTSHRTDLSTVNLAEASIDFRDKPEQLQKIAEAHGFSSFDEWEKAEENEATSQWNAAVREQNAFAAASSKRKKG